LTYLQILVDVYKVGLKTGSFASEKPTVTLDSVHGFRIAGAGCMGFAALALGAWERPRRALQPRNLLSRISIHFFPSLPIF
jgi:hypothetical protein